MPFSHHSSPIIFHRRCYSRQERRKRRERFSILFFEKENDRKTEEGSCYSLLGGIVLRKQERPVIDFNRERCNDAVLSPGVPGQQSDGLDPPHPFGFIRCGIQRARATTDPSLSNLLRLLKSTAKLFLHLEIRKEQLQSFVHSDQIKIIREILLLCKILIYVYKKEKEEEIVSEKIHESFESIFPILNMQNGA